MIRAVSNTVKAKSTIQKAAFIAKENLKYLLVIGLNTADILSITATLGTEGSGHCREMAVKGR